MNAAYAFLTNFQTCMCPLYLSMLISIQMKFHLITRANSSPQNCFPQNFSVHKPAFVFKLHVNINFDIILNETLREPNYKRPVFIKYEFN